MRLSQSIRSIVSAAATDGAWGSGELLVALVERRSLTPALERAVDALSLDAADIREAVAPRSAANARPASAALEARDALTTAKWLAAYLRRPVAEPEHLLLALAWDPIAVSALVLAERGVTFADAWGVLTGDERVPPELVPETAPVPVAGDLLERVVARLPGLLPPGTTFGFNRTGDSGWVWATDDTDITPFVEEAARG